ncbi:MAG: hypothetical protein ACYTF6_12965, partial [Planctomycetota bacterium]
EAERARKVAQLTEAVAAAEDPSSAAAAYARANAMDSTNVKLHETYMNRMLKFGLPKIALYPARTLMLLEPEHGMAWSVIGYMHGREGEFAEAFHATMLAAKQLQDNPSVLNNAGQLAAWYDNEPDLPELSAASRRWLEQIRGRLEKTEEYVRAYERTVEAYKQRFARSAEYEQKLPAAEVAISVLRGQLAEAEAEYRAIADRIDFRSRLIDSLKRELYYAYWYARDVEGNLHSYYRFRRQELRDRIRGQERDIEWLRQEAYGVRAAAGSIQMELKIREKELEVLRGKLQKAIDQVYRRLRWDPPAVDGVVTAEVERFIYTQPKPGTVSEDPEVLAARRLKAARLYIRHDIRDKAIEILTEIITDYRSTEAAEEAGSMLDLMDIDR